MGFTTILFLTSLTVTAFGSHCVCRGSQGAIKVQSIDVVATSLLAQLAKADGCQSKEANPDGQANASQIRVEGLANAQTNLLQRPLAACELLADKVSCEAKHGLHGTRKHAYPIYATHCCGALWLVVRVRGCP